MKIYIALTIALLPCSVALLSCTNKPDTTTATESTVRPNVPGETQAPAGDPTTQTQQPVQSAQPNAGTPSTTTPSTAASGNAGIPHFMCTTPGCKGRGDAQGKCPVCGKDLVHNAAYHSQVQGDGSAAAQAPQTYPAKNAKGVYHWACTKAGCDGGAGEAGKCPKCGSDLAHNQEYHNQ